MANAKAIKEEKEGVFTGTLRKTLFGRQNERLEYLIDSYSRLSPEARMGTVVAGTFVGFLAVFGVISLFVMGMGSLEKNLETSLASLNELKVLEAKHTSASQRFKTLSRGLEKATGSGFELITFLDQATKKMGLTDVKFKDKATITPLPDTNPLSTKLSQVETTFSIKEISLRKIIELVVSIESNKHKLIVTEVSINSFSTEKLFFRANFKVQGYVNKR